MSNYVGSFVWKQLRKNVKLCWFIFSGTTAKQKSNYVGSVFPRTTANKNVELLWKQLRTKNVKLCWFIFGETTANEKIKLCRFVFWKTTEKKRVFDVRRWKKGAARQSPVTATCSYLIKEPFWCGSAAWAGGCQIWWLRQPYLKC